MYFGGNMKVFIRTISHPFGCVGNCNSIPGPLIYFPTCSYWSDAYSNFRRLNLYVYCSYAIPDGSTISGWITIDQPYYMIVGTTLAQVVIPIATMAITWFVTLSIISLR
jgi:hypothetical protein